MKKQNGTINVIKFAGSLLIMLLHCAMYFGFPEFQGGWIMVEWFYIFAGFIITAGIYSQTNDIPVWQSTWQIIWKRVSSIYPYFFVSCLIGLGVKIWSGDIPPFSFTNFIPFASEFLMLQMTGLRNRTILGTSWFLSSMWIVLPFFIPCIIRFKKNFSRLFALVIPILIYGYIDKTYGYLWSPVDWLGICTKGTLRAVCGLCLGAVSYELSEILRNKLNKPLLESIVVYVAYLLIFVFMYRYDDSLMYYFIPFIFTVLIAVTMSKKPGFDIPDNRFTRFLNRISMLLFLNHAYWVMAIQKVYPQWTIGSKMLASFITTAISILLVYVIAELIKKIAKKTSYRSKCIDS